MAGSTNFLVFNENLQNIIDDATYAANTARTNGITTGPAQSNLHNKLFRQLSVMVAAVGQLISDQDNVASDIDLPSLVSALTNSVLTPGVSNKSIRQIKTLLVNTDTRSVTVTKTGGAITGLTVKDPSDNSTVKTVTVNRVGGVISSVVSVAGGKTITQTVNRTDGIITNITKEVV